MNRFFSCTIVALLAGCTGGDPASDTPLQQADSHAALAASVGDAFIWDCTMTQSAGTYPTRFILQRQDAALRPFVMMLEAGAPRAQRTEIKREGYARRVTLPDHSAILITDSGEVFAIDVRGQPVEGRSLGQCRKGAQPL